MMPQSIRLHKDAFFSMEVFCCPIAVVRKRSCLRSGGRYNVEMVQGGSGMDIKEIDAIGQRPEDAASASPHELPATLEAKSWCGKYVLPSSAFTRDVVGAKALNLIRLRVRSYLHKIQKLESLSRILRFTDRHYMRSKCCSANVSRLQHLPPRSSREKADVRLFAMAMPSRRCAPSASLAFAGECVSPICETLQMSQAKQQ